jgi:hypothetical protein
MLDTRALIALALSPSERSHFAERCYAGGYEALENDDTRRAALLFALVALTQPTDPRGWLGLARAAEEIPEASAGLEALADAVAPSLGGAS